MNWCVFLVCLCLFSALDLNCYFSMPKSVRTAHAWVLIPGAGIVEYMHYSPCGKAPR